MQLRTIAIGIGALVVSVAVAQPARAADNGVAGYGSATTLGAPAGTTRPVVSMTADPAGGYWLVSAEGGLFAYGGAPFYGAPTDVALQSPIVDITSTPTGDGYWMVAADGGVFNYGKAGFYGSMAGVALRRGIASIISSPSGHGYMLIATDGGVFAFGDAPFHGSLVGRGVSSDVVDLVERPQGDGYWIITANGGTFAFGGAPDLGSLSASAVTASGRIVGAASTLGGDGLWLASSDGGVFAMNAPFYGASPPPAHQQVTAIAAKPDGFGYWLATSTSLAPGRPGESGNHVIALKQRLNDLHFWAGGLDPNYGGDLSQAVLAFQKYVGLPRTGAADRVTIDALNTASPAQAQTTAGDAIEVDKTRQILFVVVGGATQFVFNTSTGTGRMFSERSPITGRRVVGDATTPEGHFAVYFERGDGWRQSDLGKLWRPKFFHAGFAVHGSLDVPGFPASHGCIRVSVNVMNFIWAADLMPRGRDVWIY